VSTQPRIEAPDLQAAFAAGGYPAAAQALVEAFPARGDDRQFLGCWIPQAKLQTAMENCMRAHGDPARWWDDLDLHLEP
jgi:hypothetical protein